MLEHIIGLGVRHKTFVALLFCGVCVSGIYSLARLPIDAFPDVSPNLVQVFGEVEGTAAEEVEQFVTRPVEIAMMGISGVKKIRSVSSYGLSTVNVYFEDDVDIYRAHQLVNERLDKARESIPQQLRLAHGLEKGPIVSGMGKILAYYVEGDAHDTTKLRTLQDWVIKRDLLTIPGVADVLSQGGHVKQYHIRVIPEKLYQYHLTLDDVEKAVQANNMSLGAGIMARGSEELIVRAVGLIRNVDDISRIAIRTYHGTPIRVGDVASVSHGEAFRRGVASLDGKREVVIGSVYKAHGANSLEIIRRLQRRIAALNATLPEGVRIVPYYDQSTLVMNTFYTMRTALLMGLTLVCVVAFVFLGSFRNAVIMVCSMPFAMLLAFVVMQQSGVAGDLISFGGIAIALGMIIDATIIIVEKIQSSARDAEGQGLVPIVMAAGREVGPPIVFAIAIIVMAFLPIFTLHDVEGKMFRPLAFTVTSALLGSLLYALVIAPVFYCVLHPRSGGVVRGTGAESFFHRVYRRCLAAVLQRCRAVIACMGMLMLCGIGVFTTLGSEFVPTLREGDLQVLAHMDPNIALDEICAMARMLEADIVQVPEVKYVVSEIGYGEVGPHVHHTNYACMTVGLTGAGARDHHRVIDAILGRVGLYPGVSLSFSQPIQHEIEALISGAGTQVVAKIFGPELSVLAAKVEELEHLLSGVPGVADVRAEQFTGQTQLRVEMDADAAARYALTAQTIQEAMRTAIGGVDVGQVLEEERSFAINLRFAEPYRNSVRALEDMLIRTPDGGTVPLKELAQVRTVTGLREIRREDTQRFIAVQCNVRGRDPGGFVMEAQNIVEKGLSLPPGYRVAWGGAFELQQTANRRLMIVVPVTLLLVVMLLFGLFGSLKNVLLIVLNIPLALVGGVLSLACFGGTLSIPSSIGFIALFGIALTDGLVLISRFEGLRRGGMELQEAVIAGALSKLRPVVMTTITTALGLLPMILTTGVGSEVQRPLAIVVVGGLFSSTLLTLIVLPVLYHTWQREPVAQCGEGQARQPSG